MEVVEEHRVGVFDVALVQTRDFSPAVLQRDSDRLRLQLQPHQERRGVGQVEHVVVWNRKMTEDDEQSNIARLRR